MTKVIHLVKYSIWHKRDGFACDFSKVPDALNSTTDVKQVTCKKCLHVIERDNLQ